MAIVGLRLKSLMQRPLPTTDSDSKFHGVHVLFYFLPNPIADIEPMTFQLQCWHANHCTNTDISYIYAVQLVTYNVLQIIIVLFSQRTSTGVFNGISLCESPPKGFGWSGDSHRMRENGRYSDQVQRVGTAVFEREREREREREAWSVCERELKWVLVRESRKIVWKYFSELPGVRVKRDETFTPTFLRLVKKFANWQNRKN